jgi:hypothetical protein
MAFLAFSDSESAGYSARIPDEFYSMLPVGFIPELVDGALGMGIVMCATTMMFLGVNHWYIVLGLIVGGRAVAPLQHVFQENFQGELPRF